LVYRGFNIRLGEFYYDLRLPDRVECIDQTECGEKEDEDIEDDVCKSNGFQGYD
jgi:hypothetical protein